MNHLRSIRTFLNLVLLSVAMTMWMMFVFLPFWYYIKPIPDLRWVLEQSDITRYIRPEKKTWFLASRPISCYPNTTLVVMVASSVHNFRQRNVVRATWASPEWTRLNVRVLFMVGTRFHENRTITPKNKKTENLLKESETYGDIIQEDFVDNYNNLTLKTLMMLKWTTYYCSHVPYVLKTDDDVFVHIPNVFKILKKVSASENKVFGYMFTNMRPFKDWTSKWYVPSSIYQKSVYPKFASGAAYLMTRTAAERLYSVSWETPFFHLEDVFLTGLCADKMSTERIHVREFSYFVLYPGDPCLFRTLVAVHDRDMFKLWRAITTPSILCFSPNDPT